MTIWNASNDVGPRDTLASLVSFCFPSYSKPNRDDFHALGFGFSSISITIRRPSPLGPSQGEPVWSPPSRTPYHTTTQGRWASEMRLCTTPENTALRWMTSISGCFRCSESFSPRFHQKLCSPAASPGRQTVEGLVGGVASRNCVLQACYVPSCCAVLWPDRSPVFYHLSRAATCLTQGRPPKISRFGGGSLDGWHAARNTRPAASSEVVRLT